MSIFGVLEMEAIIQTGDKTRLSAKKSFVSKDEAAVTLVEIEPESGAGYIAVTGTSSKDWFLDWVYVGISRVVTVSLRITTDGAPSVFTKTMQVITSADDKLFSSDSDLIALEPDILKWVPEGRSSFLNVHRQAQSKIIEWLDEAGITDTSGARLTKADIVDVEEVKPWSRDLTLSLIFYGIHNAVDDVFMQKSKYYDSQAKNRADRAKLRLDLNNDGSISSGESANVRSRELIRE